MNLRFSIKAYCGLLLGGAVIGWLMARSMDAGKGLDFAIAITGSLVGGGSAFLIARWSLNAEQRDSRERNIGLLKDIFDPVKMEVRDNRNRLIKLYDALEGSPNQPETWEYAEAIASSIQDSSYKMLLSIGLAPYLPSSLSKTLYTAYSSLEGLKNYVHEGNPAARYYAGVVRDQSAVENVLENVRKVTMTTKNYLDYAVVKLWEYKPGAPDTPLAEYERYPLSASLVKFAKDHPEFDALLSAWKSSEVMLLPVILLTSVPTHDDVEVIGIFRLNKPGIKDKTKPLFIQDYIVNNLEGDFVLYSDVTGHSDPAVLSIDEFSKVYGQGKYYGTENGKLDHEYFKVDELPEPVRDTARNTLKSVD